MSGFARLREGWRLARRLPTIAAILLLAGACWVAGASAAVPAGNVLEFDGVNDHARADASVPLLLGDSEGEDFTIETFFFVPNQTDTEIQRYVWRETSYGLFIDFSTTPGQDIVNFRFWGNEGATPGAAQGMVQVTTGWHHMAGVYDNEFTSSTDRFAVYLDGTQLLSTTVFEFTPGIYQGAGPHVFVGHDADQVTGLMDEVRFSDSPRYSGSYTVPTSPFVVDANTRALWHFDDACGSTLFQDSSGNANTLFAQNGATTVPAGELPPVPSITDTDPDSPSSDNSPEVKGTLENCASPTDVKVFTNATCSETPAATASVAHFTGPGITVNVPSNELTNLSAKAVNGTGDSACSASFSYTEDSTAPETTIDSGPPSTTSDSTPTFGFSSDAGGATFACRVDSDSFAPCTSPHTTAALTTGEHHFDVQAIDAAGNQDPTPAGQTFTVSAQPPAPQCADGSDNDGDGLTDFPADPGCLSASDSDETNVTTGIDTTPPGGAVSGRQTQKLDATVEINAACRSTIEDCLISASGTMNVPNAPKVFRLKRVRNKLVRSGRRVNLRLRVPTRALRAARRALRKRRRISAKITVRVADAAGNATILRRVIRFKR